MPPSAWASSWGPGHWQFYNDFYCDHEFWRERLERILKQLVRQTEVDPDAFQFCMDTQAAPWLSGFGVIGHQKLGDWHSTPVFRLEDRRGQDIRTWHEVLNSLTERY